MIALLAEIPTPIDAVKEGAGAVGGFIADKAADTFLEPIGHAIARGLAAAAKKVAEELMHFMSSSAGVRFDQGWWAGDRAQTLVREIAALALVLTLLFLLLAIVQGLFAGDVGAMLRATAREVPVSIGATLALVAVTQLLLGLVDGASSMVLAGVPEALGHFFDGFGEVAVIESAGFMGLVMVGVFIVGSVFVWIELVVRSSLIYLLMAAAPLTLAARVWPSARGAWRRLAELGIALIVSKFAISLALGLGAAALAGGGPKTGDLGTQVGMDLAAMLGGASLMLLAAITPFIVLKLLPVVEAAVVAQGISRSPVRAAQSGMQASYYAHGLSRMAGGRAGGSRPGGGTGGGGPNGGGSSGGGPGGGDGPGGGGDRPSPAGPPSGPSPLSGAGPGGGEGGTGSKARPAGGGQSAGAAAARGGGAATAGTGAATIPVGALSAAAMAAAAATKAASTASSAAADSRDPRRSSS